MTTLRKLQLRQGQELSKPEQQQLMAGEWFCTSEQKGICYCKVPNNDAHVDRLTGYVRTIDWGGALEGVGKIVTGAAELYFSRGKGKRAYLGMGSLLVGAGKVYSSFYSTRPHNYTVTNLLISENQHRQIWAVD